MHLHHTGCLSVSDVVCIKWVNVYLHMRKYFFPREKYKRETISSSTGWGFVEWQPCARNDRLALGRPHMGLISPHFSFILSWQNNGCLWRVSYPLLSLSPRPKCLSLRGAIHTGLVHRDRLKFHVPTLGCGCTPPVLCLWCIIWCFPLSAFPLIILKFKKKTGQRNKKEEVHKFITKGKTTVAHSLRKRWDILFPIILSQSNKTHPSTSVCEIQRQCGQQSVERSQQRVRMIRKHGTVRP